MHNMYCTLPTIKLNMNVSAISVQPFSPPQSTRHFLHVPYKYGRHFTWQTFGWRSSEFTFIGVSIFQSIRLSVTYAKWFYSIFVIRLAWKINAFDWTNMKEFVFVEFDSGFFFMITMQLDWIYLYIMEKLSNTDEWHSFVAFEWLTDRAIRKLLAAVWERHS